MPCSEKYSPRVFFRLWGRNATETLGMVASYWVMHTKVREKAVSAWEAVKLWVYQTAAISRARSGREVEEYHRIFRPNSAGLIAYRGQNETRRLRLPHRIFSRRFLDILPGYPLHKPWRHKLFSTCSPVTLGRTIHGIVASHDGGNAADADFLQFFLAIGNISLASSRCTCRHPETHGYIPF